LDAVLNAAREGAGGVLAVEGLAGIGKTSLLASARQRASGSGITVLNARGTPLERDYAMGLVRQSLEPAVRVEPDHESLFVGAARLARTVLFDLPGDAAATTVGVLHGLYWLTANLAERAPLLLTIDDAHWADEPSLRFLAYLTRRVESVGIALVIATRPSEDGGAVAEILGEIRSDPATELVHLRPLAVAGVQAVLRELGGAPVEQEFARACHEATGGNPFLLSELVRTLRSEGVPFTAGSAARLGGFAPPTVARRVRATLERLGPGAAALTRAVAVLGEEVELDLAAELAGVPMGEAAGVAGALAQAGVFADATPLRFLHPLLSGAVQAGLSMPERATAHARAAQLLRARGASPERIALQLMHAAPGGDEQVVAELRTAADRARSRGATATVVDLLRRALVEPPAAKERGELLLELGQAEYALGRTAEAATHLEEAHRCAAKPILRGRALIGLFQARAGDFSAQRAMTPLFEQTLPEVFEQDRELGLRLWTLKLLAVEPGPQWDLAAPEMAGLRCETPGEAILLGHLALPITNRRATAAEVAAVCERAAQHADALLEEGATALVMTGIVLGLWWADRIEAAEKLLDRAIAVAGRRGATGDYALAHQFRASIYRRAGRLRDAEADARSALAASGGAGWAGAGGAIIPLLGSLVDQGRVEEAAQELTAAHPGHGVVDAPAMTHLLLERMRLRAAQGRIRDALIDWEEARRRGERHFREINASWVPDLLVAAECRHAAGEPDARDALMSEALTLAEHWGPPGFIGEARHRAARFAGGDHSIEALVEAVELLRRSPARLELARALVSLGEVLRRRGRRVDSRKPLQEGYELARQCGATGLAGRARAELRASGIRLRREALTGADSLTASEQRIAEMAAGGASNVEIAQALFLTVKTVESHLTHAYRKLDLSRRSQLVHALAPKT
jgi:DNA-binding CsgD family transcriptional regulator